MPSQTRPSPWDHPRSRGVYGECAGETIACGGSSPLARGLQPERTSRDGHHGIIPARAGFTGSVQEKRSHAADHPRSRGVYCARSRARMSAGGSSPLARGLRTRWPTSWCSPGIIPARAGFTARCRPGLCPRTDHPRSRGVYHADSVRRRAYRGIIPARAGFTSSARPTSSARWDHPRSRGVYAYEVDGSKGVSGSSPLARGLPWVFSFVELLARDHPRSRGVYTRIASTCSCRNGSSPLARGLPGRGRPQR